MFLNHVALVCSSEDNSDRFFQEVLGLEKMQSKTIPSYLSELIFGFEGEYKLINYGNDSIRFEIFLSNRQHTEVKKLDHVCIEVEHIGKFLTKCAKMRIEIIRIPKGDSLLVFIRDYDGNLFEIKEKN
ncbi:MAG: hypothetical protein GY795_08605 [Desulfobacterales bacterium]|nr:hypothetical protein [Desulfobacterales bacterium]